MMEKKDLILYQKQTDCCGCGACFNVCPEGAISMEENQYGFLYPKIDRNICIGCGKCKKVCVFQKREKENFPMEIYTLAARNEIGRNHFKTNKIFMDLSQIILNKSGYVFAPALTKDLYTKHSMANTKKYLLKLQGCKYVQSDTVKTFLGTKTLLDQNARVMYYALPCQIAGLKSFLGKEYNNLITIDEVCRGVTSNQMFRDYLRMWRNQRKEISESCSVYFYCFMHGWIYRESCYECQYTLDNRPADITIGVHWNESRNTSGIMVNTPKGERFIQSAKRRMHLKKISFKKYPLVNHPLKDDHCLEMRKKIFKMYRSGGWEEVAGKIRIEND